MLTFWEIHILSCLYKKNPVPYKRNEKHILYCLFNQNKNKLTEAKKKATYT